MGKEANFRERALYAFSPKRGNEMYQRRMKKEAEKTGADISTDAARSAAIKMSASYFGIEDRKSVV